MGQSFVRVDTLPSRDVEVIEASDLALFHCREARHLVPKLAPARFSRCEATGDYLIQSEGGRFALVRCIGAPKTLNNPSGG